MDMSELAAKIDQEWPPDRTIATTAELVARGLSPRLLAAAVRCTLLYRIRHGVYLKMSVWHKMWPSDKDLLRIAAHFKATRGTALYSHLSAARLLGLYVWDAGPEVDIMAPSSPSSTSKVPGVRVHRRNPTPATHLWIQHPRLGQVKVTTLEQTIVDCARTQSFATAVIIGDSGLHKGASLEMMQALLDTLPGGRGVRTARKVLSSLNSGSESAGETRLRLAVSDTAVPQPEYQVWLEAAGNRYRVDGAWRDIKLALEFDGKTKYFDYKRTDETIYAERQRERELMEEGWTFLRVEWNDLGNPDSLKRRILASMETARRRTALS